MVKKINKLNPPLKSVQVREVEGTVRRNVDYSAELHHRLEEASHELNVSSQALVKIALQEWLDRFVLARHYNQLSQMAKTGTE